ncbi:MAG TPA: non-homologous end-joining DNA ligase [Tepidisphaeraceae bacterium]|jgi:bifunctional non-homologous end joining protein LigD|nr:non-homologous end-joining DNA ligase [Tepidisphaeraceae bacterium]
MAKPTAAKSARGTSSGRAGPVPVTNLDKVLFPSGFTKGQMIDYYERISPVLLPHLRGRALTLKRYPNGSDKPFFFEKNCPSHRPDWVKTATITGRKSGDSVNHCVIDTKNGLRWTANLGAIELHVPLSHATKPDAARALAFDFDPGPGITVIDCARLAIRVRDLLRDFELQTFPKTSGGKGFHLYIPLNGAATFDETKSFAHSVALTLEKDDPKRVTASMSKSDRPKRIFIDWSQNDRHKTTVCVYSLRARESPSVSTPLAWDEVESAITTKDADALRFDADAVLNRVEALGDLFEPVLKLKQKLPQS